MNRWDQIEELFHVACELEPGARADFLNRAFQGDLSLRQEVERLLAAVHKPVDIIDHPPTKDAIRLIAAGQDDSIIGRMLNQYLIIALLGDGGMGTVYLAEDTTLDRKVALKVLPPSLTEDEDRVRRLQHEARAASAINHPNLITVYETAQAGSVHFIAMEFVTGQTLRQVVRGGRMPLRELLNIAIQVASGLAAAHQAGIIHRDIKPENIMVRDDGYAKILDFGIAKLKEAEPADAEKECESEAELNRSRSALWGTVSYMSPEQVRREQVDHRTDLFSLGVVLYEMATGQRPFLGESAGAILTSLVQDIPAPIAEQRPGAPRGLETIIDMALKKNRDERYQSATELLGDLDELRRQLQATRAERAPQPKLRSAGLGRRLSIHLRFFQRKRLLLIAGLSPAAAALIDFMFWESTGDWNFTAFSLLVLAVALCLIYAVRLRRISAAIPKTRRPVGAFRGLEPFGERDVERFYGREQDVAAVLKLVSEHRFSVLFGDSGSGKTSLLSAGVIPKIAQVGLLPIYCRSYSEPLTALTEECSRRSGIQPVAGESPLAYVSRICEETGAGVLILCDQFEEFFVNFRNRAEREPFISFVEECYRREDLPVKFLFSIRDDRLHLIAGAFDRRVPEPLLSGSRYCLRHLDQEKAREIIESSAGAVGLALETSLCREIARDLANDEEVLPSELQIVGWQLQDKAIHTLDSYLRAGGKEEFVHSFLEDVIRQAEDREAAELVLRSLISAENTRLTLTLKEVVRRTQRDQGLVERALTLFVNNRLIREIQDDEPWRYEVMHEYLIPMINRSTAKVMDARQRANLKFQRHLLDYQLNARHRIPLNEGLFIRRYSDIERGEPGRKLIRKSLQWGTAKTSLLAVLLAVVTTGAAAWLSRGEEWEQLVLKDGHTAAVHRGVFSPDGKLFVSGDDDGKVIVWDFERRQRIATLAGHTDVVNALSFSADGKWIASGSYDHTVIVWNAARLEQETVLREQPGRIGALGFSPDGRVLASASGDSDPRTALWEVGSWRKLRDLPIGSDFCSVLFGPNGNELSLSAAGAGAVTWNIVTGRSLPDRLEPDGRGTWAEFSPDGTRMVAVDSRGEVKFSDLARRKLLKSVRAHRDNGRAAAISSDGRLAATGAEDIVLWDAVKMDPLVTFEHDAVVWSIAFSPDGRSLVSTHGDGSILVWDLVERKRAANLNQHSGPVRSIAFSSDGKRLASASEDRSVIIWDTERLCKEAVLIGDETRVMGAALSPDGKWLASCDQDGTVICWDLATRERRWTVVSRKREDAHRVVISPDGLWVAASHGVYDSANGHQVCYLDASERWLVPSAIYGMVFSPDGRYLVYPTAYGDIVVWNTETWRIIDRLDSLDTSLTSISFSPDGKRFVTGDDEKRVRLWGIFPLRDLGLLGHHTARVKEVAFSPDGKEIASASDDGTIALWDVNRKRLITHIGTHSAPVISVAFSPDGKQIASGEHDKSVRLYTRHATIFGRRSDLLQWLR